MGLASKKSYILVPVRFTLATVFQLFSVPFIPVQLLNFLGKFLLLYLFFMSVAKKRSFAQ